MSNNNDYPTGNLLDFAYFKKYYILLATNLSKKAELKLLLIGDKLLLELEK